MQSKEGRYHREDATLELRECVSEDLLEEKAPGKTAFTSHTRHLLESS